MPAKKETNEKLVKEIKKSAKKEIVEKEDIEFLPSATVIMDCIGGGGHPTGGMVNIKKYLMMKLYLLKQ
jgi:hypothetical protein